MPPVQEIRVEKELAVAPEVAWERFTDHLGWAEWAGAREVVLRQEGDPAPNGLGAIRVLHAHGLAVEEEVIAFEPPRRLRYRVVAGLPIRDHTGEVEFEPSDAATRLTWTIRFRPLVPGTGRLARWALQKALQNTLQRLSEDLAPQTPETTAPPPKEPHVELKDLP